MKQSCQFEYETILWLDESLETEKLVIKGQQFNEIPW